MASDKIVQLKSYDDKTGQEIGNIFPITTCESVKVDDNKTLTDELLEINETFMTTINELSNQLKSIQQSLGYKRFSRVVTLSEPVKTIDIGIDEYAITDILDVYISGVKLVENVAYTLDKNNKTITCIDQTFGTEQILLEVIKVN